MKSLKKILSLTLVATMVLSLAGCGASDKTAEATTFKIGGIGPTTGDAAVYGLATKYGAELAIKEINEAGGINGYTIEYNFQDDVADPEKGVNAYNTLKDWGMNVLMGCTTSGSCLAVVAETEKDKMLQLTPSASNIDVIKPDNVFQVCFTDPNQGIGSADYIAQHNLATKVAVIYDSSDQYSSGIYNKFVEGANAQDVFEIVSAEAFTKDSKSDFSVQLNKAKEAGADLVFLPIYYSEAALILSQAAAMDFAPTFFGCDGLDGLLAVENFDTTLAEGVILLTPFAADATDDKTVAFVNAYKEAYGDIPNQFAADAYDAIYAMKAAIEKSGATPADGVSGICEKASAAMAEITIDGLTGDGMTWTANGEVNKNPKAMKIVDGNYAIME